MVIIKIILLLLFLSDNERRWRYTVGNHRFDDLGWDTHTKSETFVTTKVSPTFGIHHNGGHRQCDGSTTRRRRRRSKCHGIEYHQYENKTKQESSRHKSCSKFNECHNIGTSQNDYFVEESGTTKSIDAIVLYQEWPSSASIVKNEQQWNNINVGLTQRISDAGWIQFQCPSSWWWHLYHSPIVTILPQSSGKLHGYAGDDDAVIRVTLFEHDRNNVTEYDDDVVEYVWWYRTQW